MSEAPSVCGKEAQYRNCHISQSDCAVEIGGGGGTIFTIPPFFLEC